MGVRVLDIVEDRRTHLGGVVENTEHPRVTIGQASTQEATQDLLSLGLLQETLLKAQAQIP
ncbi:hypothetical protein D3C80_2132810 [compost metagenome]